MYRPKRRIFAGVLALGLGLNSAWMLLSPASWYPAIPGVEETGAYNPHFVRDIGGAYLMAALGFVAYAIAPQKARQAALGGAAFLSLHALVHAMDLFAGREELHHLLGDALLVFFPAVAGLWLVISGDTWVGEDAAPRPRQRATGRGLLGRIAERQFAEYERTFGYDMNYMRDVSRISTGALLRFFFFSLFLEHREDTTADVLYTAKLASVIRDDCGPCIQLVVQMAEKENVPAETLRAIFARDPSAMTESAALTWEFANAVLDRDLETADRLREAIVARWGERALVTIAFAMASAKVFPTMKYALGHGKSCMRVRVGRDEIIVKDKPAMEEALAADLTRESVPA